MLNTTGIQSTGPQGLPGSSGQAAVVDEQDAAQFEAMMSESGSASKLDELQAKLKNTQERYSAAIARADKATNREERSKALNEASLAFDEKMAIENEILGIKNADLLKEHENIINTIII